MMTSFHIMDNEENNKISVHSVQSESTSDVHFHSKQTSITDRTSLGSYCSESNCPQNQQNHGMEPKYENYPTTRPEISVRRSKSMVQKPLRKCSSNEVHFRQPSIRHQTSAARKSLGSSEVGLKRSLTFALGHHSEQRKFVPHARPLRHSNSRISEIIRQYNENQQKSGGYSCGKMEYESGSDETVVAPPVAFPDSNEVSSLDEDWLLQKSLEKKRGETSTRSKRTSEQKKVYAI